MARIKLLRLLPRLPSRSLLRRKENAREELVTILRRVALSARRKEQKSFYSLREVAQHFGLPLSTVARAYDKLEREAVISRVRGSRTILQGIAPTRHLVVRNVVAMPVSLSCFITSQDYRMLIIRARREFRRRGLVTGITFYEDRSDAEALVERIQQARADVVLWYVPDIAARITAPWLRDLGIRLLGISDGGLPSIRCRYKIARSGAISAILRDWVDNGIRDVRIVRGDGRPLADEERLETLLAETALRWQFVQWDLGSTRKFLTQINPQKSNAIVLPASTACLLLMRSPESFHRILSSYRVALPNGPVSMPLSPLSPASVDFVEVDWQAVAERMASDILSGEAFADREPLAFEATAQLGASVDKVAQKI
jgi:hypothetical protein